MVRAKEARAQALDPVMKRATKQIAKAPAKRAKVGSRTSKPGKGVPLGELKARDLASQDLVTTAPDAAIAEVLELFEDYEISALPVVDELGAPLGVISKADIARVAHLRDGRLEGRGGDSSRAEPDEELADFSGRDDYSAEVLGRATAAEWMHPGVVTVAPSATLKQLCRTMADEGIHHVLVLEKKRLTGIVSSLDVVRAIAGRV